MSNSGLGGFSDPSQPFEMSKCIQLSFVVIEGNHFWIPDVDESLGEDSKYAYSYKVLDYWWWIQRFQFDPIQLIYHVCRC
jgi:hypothetical protein